MRKLGFWIGAALALVTAAIFVAQVMAWLAGSGWLSLGSLWARINANSLVGFQALVENRLTPALWPLILQMLFVPAWLVFGVLAAVLLLLCRPRRRGFD
jgi:hypothetical protein